MPRKRLLITGSSGFVGRWCLASDAIPTGWQAAPCSDSLDLRNTASIDDQLAGTPPEAVLHLAAKTFVPQAFDDPRDTLEVNLIGTLNLLQGLARVGFRGRFIYVSSADVYGMVPPERMPIDEEQAPDPRNPYSVSKVAAEALCRQWHHSERLDLVIARPFNHIGPGQEARFVVSGLAQQFARIKSGAQAPRITVGDADAARDFTDVRDVVRAYFSLIEGGRPGERYNVCSGRAVRVREIIARLKAITGLRPELIVDSTRLRANEQKVAYGSAERLTRAVGWSPTHDLDRSLEDILTYWERDNSDEQD